MQKGKDLQGKTRRKRRTSVIEKTGVEKNQGAGKEDSHPRRRVHLLNQTIQCLIWRKVKIKKYHLRKLSIQGVERDKIHPS